MLKHLVLPVILCSLSCSPKAGPPPEEKSATPQAFANPAPGAGAVDPFSAPQFLCNALDQEDLHTRGWKFDGIDWSCSSDYQDVGSSGVASMATNLAYYVTGDSSGRAHTAKIVLNVNNHSTKSEGLSRLARAAQVLTKGANLPLPPEVVEAANMGKPVRRTVGGVTYAVEKEQTRIETFNFLLLDAEATALREQSQAAAIQTSADVFAACKHAVSRDLSYSEPALSGNGEPIEESGYQSFMISGRNRDLFFCEAYPDGTYKVKAAFAGQFPFKYVASGSL